MKLAWSSRSRDHALIADRMKRTYIARRSAIDDGATLIDMLEEYPALQDEVQVGTVRISN